MEIDLVYKGEKIAYLIDGRWVNYPNKAELLGEVEPFLPSYKKPETFLQRLVGLFK